MLLKDSGLGSLFPSPRDVVKRLTPSKKKILPKKSVQSALKQIGPVPPVFLPKQAMKKLPSIPGVRAIPTTRKELNAMQKADVKAGRLLYKEGVMRPLSKVDPVMKIHYDHELRVVEIRDLRGKLMKETDPEKRKSLEGQLAMLDKKEGAYQKQGAIVRTICQHRRHGYPGAGADCDLPAARERRLRCRQDREKHRRSR